MWCIGSAVSVHVSIGLFVFVDILCSVFCSSSIDAHEEDNIDDINVFPVWVTSSGESRSTERHIIKPLQCLQCLIINVDTKFFWRYYSIGCRKENKLSTGVLIKSQFF